MYVCICLQMYRDIDERFFLLQFSLGGFLYVYMYLYIRVCAYIILNCWILAIVIPLPPERVIGNTHRTYKLHNKRKRATVILAVLLCFASLHLNGWPSQPASHNFFFSFSQPHPRPPPHPHPRFFPLMQLWAKLLGFREILVDYLICALYQYFSHSTVLERLNWKH